MPARFSRKSVKKAAIEGMLEAGRDYLKWTEDDIRPWRAPEYFYCVKMSEKIQELPFRPAVYLEYTAADSVKPRPGRVSEKLKGKKRIDILVAPKNDAWFQVALEIKRGVNRWSNIEKDIGRLKALVDHNSPGEGVRMGLSMFLMRHEVSNNGSIGFDKKLRKMRCKIKEFGHRYDNLKTSFISPVRGGECDIATKSNQTQQYVWYVAGVSIGKP